MGNILNSGNSAPSSASFDYGYSQQVSGCCDPVVDPISLLTVIGGIAGLSLWLRQAVIDFNIMGGRRKRFLNTMWIGIATSMVFLILSCTFELKNELVTFTTVKSIIVTAVTIISLTFSCGYY